MDGDPADVAIACEILVLELFVVEGVFVGSAKYHGHFVGVFSAADNPLSDRLVNRSAAG
jgi:hypothetical protein